jgi:hypothetical protein
MREEYVLVDFENVQPTFNELIKLVSAPTEIWLFHGPHQLAAAEKMAAEHSRVTRVPRSGEGKNALDFHLSFYLGHMACKHPDAQLVIVANDKGYDPMIAHTKMLGFDVKRVGLKKKKVVATKKIAAKNSVPTKNAATPTSQKVADAKLRPKASAVGGKTAAKKVAPKKLAAKKLAPQKGTTAEAVKKMPAAVTQAPQKSAAAKKTAGSQKTGSSEAKELQRVIKGLAKMTDKKPTKFKSLLRHLGSFLGSTATPDQINLLVEKLEQKKIVTVVGDMVLYP